MELGGVQAVLRPGEAVLHFPHTAYRYAMRGESTVVYYWVHFTGFCAESIARQCGFANQEPVHAGAHGSITVRFESLFAILSSGTPALNCLPALACWPCWLRLPAVRGWMAARARRMSAFRAA